MASSEETRCPHFPAEIWIKILSSCQDPNFLWTSCRNVSTKFRYYVDAVFQDKYIKDTDIIFDDRLQERCVRYFSMTTLFDRFSEDKTRAFFREVREIEAEATSSESDDSDNDHFIHGPQRLAKKYITRNWEEAMKYYTGPPSDSSNPNELGRADQPPYSIRVHRDMNDTQIPGLEIDYEKRQISFDWRGMYTMFYQEENYVDRKIKESAMQARTEALDLKAMMDIGGLSMIDAMQRLLKRVKMSEDDARRDARRKRLDTLYRAHGLRGYNHDDVLEQEEATLEYLAQRRKNLDRYEGSDESDGDEDEDEDEDMDECSEQEWEDIDVDE